MGLLCLRSKLTRSAKPRATSPTRNGCDAVCESLQKPSSGRKGDHDSGGRSLRVAVCKSRMPSATTHPPRGGPPSLTREGRRMPLVGRGHCGTWLVALPSVKCAFFVGAIIDRPFVDRGSHSPPPLRGCPMKNAWRSSLRKPDRFLSLPEGAKGWLRRRTLRWAEKCLAARWEVM